MALGLKRGLRASGLLHLLASGPIGRLLTPLAPFFTLLGIADRSNRFILNIGDEGATLVQVRGGQVIDAIFAEASAEEGWDTLREMLRSDASAPIILVADVLEQMFREDTVPRVGLFDRGAIVKRRLDLTFPNDQLKAALPLKRARAAPQAVLFSALPMSEHLGRWVKFLDEFPNQVRGFYMLPLEEIGLADRLAPRAPGEARRVWRALLTQEAASGFRQVFESNGKLVVTRLTQRPPQALSPEGEAMLIERELRSSISYIKRLGFADGDRLDVIVFADPAVCRAVDEHDLPATSVTAYTPYQAGVMLGLGEVGREDSPFADVLLGLWVAAKRRPALMLPTSRIIQQLKLTARVRWSAGTAAVLTLLALYYTGSLLVQFAAGATDIDTLQAQIKEAQAAYDREQSQVVKGLPVPFAELVQVADSQERLTRQEIDVIGLLRKVGVTLGTDARVTNLAFESPQPSAAAANTPAAKKLAAEGKTGTEPAIPYKLQITVRLSDPRMAANPQMAVDEARTLLLRLAEALPDHEVQATHLPANVLVNQTMEGSTTAATRVDALRALSAEYLIRSKGP